MGSIKEINIKNRTYYFFNDFNFTKNRQKIMQKK